MVAYWGKVITFWGSVHCSLLGVNYHFWRTLHQIHQKILAWVRDPPPLSGIAKILKLPVINYTSPLSTGTSIDDSEGSPNGTSIDEGSPDGTSNDEGSPDGTSVSRLVPLDC